ncbi:hypothetical protein B296_00048981 [Ensete ventricosum]|uniref:Uncharacterized protein n=1 Tax=Ensete ventricosum TaxID=4639 RepID=A0A426X1T4_ENSVE|nr:hypothetical protein B296_00048981 [Ensete ventricosum]
MGSRTNTVSRKNAMVRKFARSSRTVEFRLIFRAPSQKFKILTIFDILVHGKSYEHSFMKKRDSHKLCAKVKFRLVFRAPSRKFKILAIPDVLAHVTRRVKFLSVFRVPFWKFKILAIPDVFAHGNPHEHGFKKKRDGHKRCAKSRAESSFNRFFMHCLGNLKYWPFLMY